MHRLVTLLRAGGTMLAVAGIALAVVPPSTASTAMAPVAGALGALPTASAADAESLAVEIIVANIFAPSRRPPASRYLPDDAMSDSSGTLSGGADDATMTPAAFEPILFGTMVDSAGSLALVQFSMTDPAPRLVRVGDRVGDWRVISIAPRTVVLQGPPGRITLRLPTEEARP